MSKLRREQATQHELVESLKAMASDNSWAIADVKHGQEQTEADLGALKERQDHITADVLSVKHVQEVMQCW